MSSGIHIDSVTQILDNFNVDIGFICPHLYKYSLVILVGIGSKENGKNRRLIKTSFQWIQLLHFPDHFRVSLSHFRLRTDRDLIPVSVQVKVPVIILKVKLCLPAVPM